jgi:hypothetical protein
MINGIGRNSDSRDPPSRKDEQPDCQHSSPETPDQHNRSLSMFSQTPDDSLESNRITFFNYTSR